MAELRVSMTSLNSLKTQYPLFDDQDDLCSSNKYLDCLETQESIFYYVTIII